MERRIKLKDKRERFVNEYLVDFDAKNAAIRAGYSYHSADDLGARLLKNPDVAAVLEKRLAAYKKKYEIRREFIIDNLLKLIEECKGDEFTKADRVHLVKALDMLNKMSGQYSHTIVNVDREQPLFPD